MSDPRDNVQQEFLAEAQELVEALSRDLLLLDEAHHRGERIDKVVRGRPCAYADNPIPLDIFDGRLGSSLLLIFL